MYKRPPKWRNAGDRQWRKKVRQGDMPLTVANVAIISAFVGIAVGAVSTQLPRRNAIISFSSEDRSGDLYFARCSEARAAGVAPIYRNEPGYREGLDGDGDGVACEPYRGR
ncbi:MAG: excalibur calcium-binding domain-containing protein [Sphingomonadaceae bacterium]